MTAARSDVATTDSSSTSSIDVAARVGVVVTTTGDSEFLGRALVSLLSQNGSSDFPIRVVVSSPRVEDVSSVEARARSIFEGSSRVRVLHEPTGLASKARNRGWQDLDTIAVAFLDDDAEADPDWIERIAARFDGEDAPNVIAGRTDLRWIGASPTPEVAGAAEDFTALDYGPSRLELRYPRAPIGPNFIATLEALESAGGFEESLGPGPGRQLVGEESDLSHRIALTGGAVEYDPEIVVHHLTRTDRISLDHLRTRARVHGASRALVDRRHFGLGRIPHQVIRLLRAIKRCLPGSPDRLRGRLDLIYGMAYFRAIFRR